MASALKDMKDKPRQEIIGDADKVRKMLLDYKSPYDVQEEKLRKAQEIEKAGKSRAAVFDFLTSQGSFDSLDQIGVALEALRETVEQKQTGSK